MSDILFWVANVPSAVKNAEVPLSPEETEATGVPLFTFKKPNLALVVAVPPINTSSVELMG